MPDFAEVLRGWQLFYATVATSAATLTGLLFVSLSLERSRGASAGPQRLRIARETFGDFLYVLMIALVFLVPDQTPAGFAVALFVLSLARGIGLARLVLRASRSGGAAPTRGQVMREIALPGITVVGLFIVSLAVVGTQYVALYGLVAVLAALLGKASWNAWILLVE